MKVKVKRFKNYVAVQTALQDGMEMRVRYATQIVRGEVISGIQAESRGESVVRYTPHRRTHRASRPGDYPATDLGALVKGITTRIRWGKNRITGFVDSTVKYSRALEFGTSKMAARPFLQPSLEKSRNRIRSLFRGFKI